MRLCLARLAGPHHGAFARTRSRIADRGPRPPQVPSRSAAPHTRQKITPSPMRPEARSCGVVVGPRIAGAFRNARGRNVPRIGDPEAEGIPPILAPALLHGDDSLPIAQCAQKSAQLWPPTVVLPVSGVQGCATTPQRSRCPSRTRRHLRRTRLDAPRRRPDNRAVDLQPNAADAAHSRDLVPDRRSSTMLVVVRACGRAWRGRPLFASLSVLPRKAPSVLLIDCAEYCCNIGNGLGVNSIWSSHEADRGGRQGAAPSPQRVGRLDVWPPK